MEDRRQLKHGDIIGLGCEESIFDLIKPDDIEKYFIFKLIDKTVDQGNGIVIDLVSDDEEENQKPIIVADEPMSAAGPSKRMPLAVAI